LSVADDTGLLASTVIESIAARAGPEARESPRREVRSERLDRLILVLPGG
jgi:hypothetical protein